MSDYGDYISLDEAAHREPHFTLVPFDKIKVPTERAYLIKGIFPREALIVVWGPPKCSKTFWTFDGMMHIALDREYRGRRVTQGPVVYVVCEGERGIGARVEAYRQRHLAEDHGPVPFYLVLTSLDLVAEHETLISCIRAQIGNVHPVAITIDTLNRSLAGSESKDEDMSAYVRAADAVREAFKCAVVLIHHCGVDGTRPRGHTSLTGGCDAQLAVKRDKNGLITVLVEYMKDGAEGDIITSRLEVVEVGQDEDNEAIISCVIVPADASEARTESKLTSRQRSAMDVLNNVLAEHGETAPDKKNYPVGVQVVSVDLWREYLLNSGVVDSGGSNPRNDFKRLKGQLDGRGAIKEWNGLMWAVAADVGNDS